jgi:hypothetical protein
VDDPAALWIVGAGGPAAAVATGSRTQPTATGDAAADAVKTTRATGAPRASGDPPIVPLAILLASAATVVGLSVRRLLDRRRADAWLTARLDRVVAAPPAGPTHGPRTLDPS